MPEQWTAVQTYQVAYLCDTCGTAMESTGIMFPMLPPRYQHRCPACGTLTVLDQCYPLIAYRPLPPDAGLVQEQLHGLTDAVLRVQQTLGVMPQGAWGSVPERLDQR